jgi:ferredoxin
MITGGDLIMKAMIDIENCISCGLCVGICPKVFRMAGDDHAEVYIKVVPIEAEATVIEAQKTCPVSVIAIE